MEPTLRLGRVPDPLTDQLDSDEDPLGLFKSSRQAYRQDVAPVARGKEPTVAPANDLAMPKQQPKQSGGTFTFDLYKGTQSESAPAPVATEKREGKFEFDLYAGQKIDAPAPVNDASSSGAFARASIF